MTQKNQPANQYVRNSGKSIFYTQSLNYTDDFLMETFGTTTPTVEQRTTYFFEKWSEWRPNRIFVMLQKGKRIHIKKILTDLGFLEMRDFQIRSGEIRFADADMKAMALLGGLQEFQDV